MANVNYSKMVAAQAAVNFKKSVVSLKKCGEGFYAKVFRVHLQGLTYPVIAKAYKFSEIGEREGKQLEFLKKSALCKIPEIYCFHAANSECPFDILFMEQVNGVCAADIDFPDDATQDAFLNEVVENLKHWHAISNPEGFGALEGPFYREWKDFYGYKVRQWHNKLLKMPAKKVFSDYVMKVVDFSAEAVDDVFSGSPEKSSLLHSDYNLWNILIDPETYRLAGVIDPSDACWGEPGMDLFHLANCRPELNLLGIYLQGYEPDEHFHSRFCFYRFWDDIKHFLRVEWYDESRFRSYAGELEEMIKRHVR